MVAVEESKKAANCAKQSTEFGVSAERLKHSVLEESSEIAAVFNRLSKVTRNLEEKRTMKKEILKAESMRKDQQKKKNAEEMRQKLLEEKRQTLLKQRRNQKLKKDIVAKEQVKKNRAVRFEEEIKSGASFKKHGKN